MHDITPERVLQVLSAHIGETQGMSISRLTTAVTGQATALSKEERAVREAVVALRRTGSHICAHPRTGYFLAAHEAELMRTCAYLYDRAMCSLEQVAAMRGVALPDLRGQLRLPT